MKNDPTDLTDNQWQNIEYLFDSQRKRQHSLQEIVKQDVDFHLASGRISDEFMRYLIDSSFHITENQRRF